jgi:hypothetical protein
MYLYCHSLVLLDDVQSCKPSFMSYVTPQLWLWRLPSYVTWEKRSLVGAYQQWVQINVPRNRPEDPERGFRGVALLHLDLGTRRFGWSAPLPGRFTPRKDPVPIVQEARWTTGPIWTCAKNLAPTGTRSLERPACSQSLYRLTYPDLTNNRRTEYWVIYKKISIIWQVIISVVVIKIFIRMCV